MLAAGIALLVAGLYFLAVTLAHARSEEDVERSVQVEEQLKREFGIVSGYMRQAPWAYRFAYRHPVAARVPGIVLVAVGLLVLGIAAVR